jgi:hypothetical protein
MIEGISILDFLGSAVFFLGTMLAFLLLKNRYRWLDTTFLGAFVLHWIVVLLSNKQIEAKFLATLLMISVVVIRVLVTKKRRAAESQP